MNFLCFFVFSLVSLIFVTTASAGAWCTKQKKKLYELHSPEKGEWCKKRGFSGFPQYKKDGPWKCTRSTKDKKQLPRTMNVHLREACKITLQKVNSNKRRWNRKPLSYSGGICYNGNKDTPKEKRKYEPMCMLKK